MKKIIIAIVVMVALGFGYWTISPFFIDKKVSEEFNLTAESEGVQLVMVLRGSFTGFDRIVIANVYDISSVTIVNFIPFCLPFINRTFVKR